MYKIFMCSVDQLGFSKDMDTYSAHLMCRSMKTSIRAILVYNHTILHVACTSSQVYIQHMKFARRTEGVKSARNIFRKAREDSRIGYHVMD